MVAILGRTPGQKLSDNMGQSVQVNNRAENNAGHPRFGR